MLLEYRSITRDCSKATGFIQPVHDEVMLGFVDSLRRGLHATYPAPDAHKSALASAPGRHSLVVYLHPADNHHRLARPTFIGSKSPR